LPAREELEIYLDAREKQGFTVMQLTAVMSEERVWGSARTNMFGQKPFLNDDPGTPAVTPGNDPHDLTQYDYWDHLIMPWNACMRMASGRRWSPCSWAGAGTVTNS
jgi:hypothetical protein